MSQTVNYSPTTPAAPAGGINVIPQNDNSNPPNISFYAPSMVPGNVNFSAASQSQVVVSGTTYYITSSNISTPPTPVKGIVIGTTFKWRVHMTKTAAGTGTFQLVIFMGTNGSISDTAEVTQTLGTQTAAVDQMDVDVMLTFTAIGASTASFYWTICPRQFAATGTGFGIAWPATASFFSGTVSSLNSTTAGLIFGLAFIATTGTPTIVVPYVEAESFNMY